MSELNETHEIAGMTYTQLPEAGDAIYIKAYRSWGGDMVGVWVEAQRCEDWLMLAWDTIEPPAKREHLERAFRKRCDLASKAAVYWRDKGFRVDLYIEK